MALVATLASCGGKRDVEKTAGSSESATQTTHRPASDGAGAAPTTTPAPTQGSASGAAQVTTRPKVVNRILIHAIDGATWRIMTPLMEAGRLPNMKRLADAGTRYELATLEPTLSPAIWTTIATGVLPDRHGIHGFEGVPGEGMQTLPNSRMRKMKAYWNILADVGRTSGTVCWWVTWPAESGGAGGYQVSDRVPYNRMEASIGRASLTAQDVNPTELLEPLARLVERPDDIEQMAVARFLKFTPEQTDQLLRAAPYKTGDYLSEFKYVYQSDRSILNMGLELLRTRPVDVAAVYFSGVDALSHLYWHWLYPEEFPRFNIPKEHIDRMKDVIPQYYVLMDEYLGRMLDAVGPETTVIIVSDHGFGGTGRLPWSGGHGSITPGAPLAPPGVLILSGPGIASDKEMQHAHVLDIAPTLLYMMGLPASEEMDGRVLMEAMAPGSPSEMPRVASYETIGTIRDPETIAPEPLADAERLERLRALGYVK